MSIIREMRKFPQNNLVAIRCTTWQIYQNSFLFQEGIASILLIYPSEKEHKKKNKEK